MCVLWVDCHKRFSGFFFFFLEGHVTILLHSGLLTHPSRLFLWSSWAMELYGSWWWHFPLIAMCQFADALLLFLLLLSLSLLLLFYFIYMYLLLNRPEAAKSPRRSPSCESGLPFLCGVIGISPLNGGDHPTPHFIVSDWWAKPRHTVIVPALEYP